MVNFLYQKCFFVYSFGMIFLGEFSIAELVPAGLVCNCLPRISTFFSNGKLKFTPNRQSQVKNGFVNIDFEWMI